MTVDRKARTATITVAAPRSAQPADPAAILQAGASWWPLAMARELDDAILCLRTNDLEIGTWILKTRGDADAVLAVDAVLDAQRGNWLVKETIGLLRRTFARLDVSSRTLFAIVDQGSCFAGTLAELLLAADRSYMLQLPDDEAGAPRIALSALNFGTYPMVNELPRLAARFCGESAPVEAARAQVGKKLDAEAAIGLGLVTFAPDDLDWDEEVRIAIEERASLSPGRAHRHGSEPALRRPGDDGNADLRPPDRVAELDLQPAERRRRARRAEGVRHRAARRNSTGSGSDPIGAIS